jgi:TolA-binding protein
LKIMTRMRAGFVLAFLGVMAIWGCAHNPAETPASVKTARLQEEIRNLIGQRDQLRQELRTAQADLERLHEEVKKQREIAKERDDLRQQLALRTSERDNNLAQLEQIRKGMRALMDQAEAAAAGNPPPLSTARAKPGDQS